MPETINSKRAELWQQLCQQLANEYRQLAGDEKRWIAERLAAIAETQRGLEELFRQVDGAQACAGCGGDCCAKGHNHMTLANLLAFLQADEVLPRADFSQTCPFLAQAGCRLAVDRRPYNCISFVCDRIENVLMPEDVERFYRLEKHLRGLYLQFAERYAGGGLTGLLLQAERLAGTAFLVRR